MQKRKLDAGVKKALIAMQKNEEESVLKSSMYTGIAYLVTVELMLLPYLFLDNHYVSLAMMLLIVVSITFLFTHYISVARDELFGRRFGEIAAISIGVAAISFGIGVVVKRFLGIDI